MKNLGELRQHPDYHRLVGVIKKKVDNQTLIVVRAGKDEDLDYIRYLSGRLSMADEILSELTVKED